MLHVAREFMVHSKILIWKTPFDKSYNKSPSYSNLNIFGCLDFAINVMPHKTKFEFKVIMCCFIGYNMGQKSYKLYDLNEKMIIISRDVVFYVSYFPFKRIKSNRNKNTNVLPNIDMEEMEFQINHQDFYLPLIIIHIWLIWNKNENKKYNKRHKNKYNRLHHKMINKKTIKLMLELVPVKERTHLGVKTMLFTIMHHLFFMKQITSHILHHIYLIYFHL